MDKLIITGLKVNTVIGVRDWERQLRQRIVLDLELETDTRRSSRADNLSDALDYGAVARRLTEHVAAQSCQLIETLAEEVARFLKNEFNVARCRVRVHKPGAIAEAECVAVEIER